MIPLARYTVRERIIALIFPSADMGVGTGAKPPSPHCHPRFSFENRHNIKIGAEFFLVLFTPSFYQFASDVNAR